MDTLKIDKSRLLDILKKNRDNHRDLFLKAQDVYRELVIKELDLMLNDAKNGSAIRRHVNFSPPEDHTSDYNRMVGMLEMSMDTNIDLSLTEYSYYVEDNWAWAKLANAKAANYTARNVSPYFVGENSALGSSY
jgi:hypothetical protein